MNGTLFPVAPPPAVEPSRSGYRLRDFQAVDCDEIERRWSAGENHVLCVHSTGLGKSLCAAELAKRRPPGTRALLVVDSCDLTKDLFRTVYRHTGRKPGVITGKFKDGAGDGGGHEIVVATKQCLCARDRYLAIDWRDFSVAVVDECEAALANDYLLMLNHIIEQNPAIKLCGLTATPLPAKNRAIADLFPSAAKEPGPLYRDLQWAYLNGWLVKPMQGILRTSMDFSTLKLKARPDGEMDYSDADIAKLMLEHDERHWLELAGGIYKITKGHTAIVVCPNSCAVADKLAGYIEGHARESGERGIAYSIHRKLKGNRSDDLMHRFKEGEFPVAVSVRMFEKGFDHDRVDMVVMVRRTKSLRFYTQAAGRGTRPLVSIRKSLAMEPDPFIRRKIIELSAKPSCTIVDTVGINDEAKDILGVIDILGRGVRDDIKERVRRMMLDRARKADEQAPAGGGPGIIEGFDVGDEARAAVKIVHDEEEQIAREKRARLSANVDVSYEIEGDAARSSRPRQGRKPKKPSRGTATIKQAKLLTALGVNPTTALSYSKGQAGQVINRYKQGGTKPDWRRVDAIVWDS